MIRRLATLLAGTVLLAAAAVPAQGVAHAHPERPFTGLAPGPVTMPDVTRHGLADVLATLHYSIAVRSVDAGPRHRLVLWPAHWTVCSQHPSAGSTLTPRERIVLRVVKWGERCP